MTSQAFFKVRHHSMRLLVIMGMIATGCGVDVGDDIDPDIFDGVNARALAAGGAGGDPDTNNTLDDDCLNLPGVVTTVQALGQGPIANANHYLPSMPGMPSGSSTEYPGCRRELLKVVVECALHGEYTSPGATPNETVIVPAAEVKDGQDTYRGAPRVYRGRHGLAPAWETRALTGNEQEFVSACIMARTNYYGADVAILMQGSDPVAYDEELRQVYTYAESTVWGNVFAQPRSLHICHNPANGFCLDAGFRVCDEASANSCGFENHGNCMDLACGTHGSPQYCDGWRNKIAVFLRQVDLNGACPAPHTPIGDWP